MTMDDFALLYGKLRAATLSRHFAINERFRTNFFFFDVRLETKMPINDFLLLTPDEQEKERWKWISHGGDNPLIFSGQLLTCLAVEFYLGRQDGLPIIHALLDSIDALYKFQGRGTTLTATLFVPILSSTVVIRGTMPMPEEAITRTSS